MVHKELPQAWWFDSHSLAKPSPWLGTTLSELDEKTKQILKLIDQDADSFAQRAEMYYKKRPVLVDMLGDLYRAHRSLAEQHDLLKLNSSGTRRTTKFGPTSSCTQSWSPPAATKGTAAGRSSSSSASVCSDDSYDSESEVDDPEEEHDQKGAPGAEEKPDQEAELMRAEIKRLEEQNSELQKVIEGNAAALREELAAKDEEKREVIRQLASCVDMVKEENRTLRECIRSSKKQQQRSPSPPPSSRGFDLKKLTKDLFSAKIFGAHCKPSSGPIVAL